MDITCPSCKTEIVAPESMAGQVAPCPNCQYEISIPKLPKKKKTEKLWRNDSASQAQLDYLKTFNIHPDKPMTKGEAYDLLAKVKAEQEKLTGLKTKPEVKYQHEVNSEPKPKPKLKLTDYPKAKTEAREKVSQLKKQITSSKFDTKITGINEKLALTTLSNETRDDLTLELENLNDEKDELQEKLEDAVDELECLIDDEKYDKEERRYLIEATLDLFGKDGDYTEYCKKPTKKQIDEVCKALDKEVADWDEGGLDEELIVVKLQSTYPELVKERFLLDPKPKGGSGCLVFLVLGSLSSLLSIFIVYVLLP